MIFIFYIFPKNSWCCIDTFSSDLLIKLAQIAAIKAKINPGIINENDKKLISRHEITASLEDFIKISSFLLKDYGEFYMVHRPDRLVDIFTVMRKNKIEPKKVKFVYPNQNKKTNLVLIKGVKNGKQFLEFENNLYVYNENGKYTDEILKIYNKI